MTRAGKLLETLQVNEGKTSWFDAEDLGNSGYPTLSAETDKSSCAISIMAKNEDLPKKNDFQFVCYWCEDKESGDPTDQLTTAKLIDAMKWCTAKGFRFNPDEVAKANKYVAELK